MMFDRLTVRLLATLTLVTLVVMSVFVGVRFNASQQLMEASLKERSLSVAKRVSRSVTPTIWNIYQKEYGTEYSIELASAILESELESPFVTAIQVQGNFGHLYMGLIKEGERIVPFDKQQHGAWWAQQENRQRYPIKKGTLSIGHVEIAYRDDLFKRSLYESLLVEVIQVAISACLFVGSLYIALRFALAAPVQSLKVAEQALDSLTEAVFVTDAQGIIVDSNPAYREISGFDEAELLRKQTPSLFLNDPDSRFGVILSQCRPGLDTWSGEVTGIKKEGTHFPAWLRLTRVHKPKAAPVYVGVLTDLAEKKATQERLHTLAYYDGLTKVPNRQYFLMRLDEAIAIAQREHGQVGLLYLDLDNFKWANDQYGHAVGDQLLVEVVCRFQARLRSSDILYRIGGDEFTVVVSKFRDEADLLSIAEALIEQASAEFRIAGHLIRSGASVGISAYPQEANSANSLVVQADRAMYQAKEAGRGQVRFFSAQLDSLRQQQQAMELQLREALHAGALQLYYQPKAHMKGRQISHFSTEALIRWPDAQGAMRYAPDQFIPVAEHSHLICEIGYWVVEAACQQVAQWQHLTHAPVSVAINLSPRQLRDEHLFDFLQQMLARYDIPASALELEITESAVIEDIEHSLVILERLKSLGFTLAMDDFGTGYSSLSYLKQLPVDVIKIDRSFISALPDDKDGVAIVEAIFSMAKALQLEVVAEGVETPEQLAFLVQHDCDIVQGFLFAPALSAGRFMVWLESEHAAQTALPRTI